MTPQELTGKHVTVVGGARSGLSVACLLAGAGVEVFLTEQEELEAAAREVLAGAGVGYEEGGHTGRALKADFFVVSPGVPSDAPLVVKAQEKGMKVVSEIEAASWFCRAPVVAITGSNGKTTTTSLLGHLFRKAGRETVVAGNIGEAFSGVVERTTPGGVAVLEVSSFQLDHIDSFRPRVSVLLNITPDHLDRYGGSFEAYAASKLRIFENQKAGDTLIYNYDDDYIREHVAQATGDFRAVGFSLHHDVPEVGALQRGDALTLRIDHKEEHVMRVKDLAPALSGKHNIYNSLAAAMAARVMEVRSQSVRESLTSFEGVPHRLEHVRTLDGVRYFNDSKATNVNAVWYALESFHEKVVLIAGGRDKGNDYESLKPLVKEKVEAVVAIGESAETVMEELGTLASHALKAETMADAVEYARLFANPGDVVLLSPACASFDMFESFEERGDAFKQAVMNL